MALALLLLLAGCGDDPPPATSQIIVAATAARPMNADEFAVFDETEACMDLDNQKPPAIEYCSCSPAPCSPCVEDRPGWWGEYRADLNRISIRPDHEGDVGLLAHESVHALLQASTGDLDPDHHSAFFRTCAPPELIGGH